MNIFKGEKLQRPETVALTTGNSFRENLADVMKLVPLDRKGYFGETSKRKGTRGVQIVKCSNPAQLAFDFQRIAGKNFVSYRSIPGKGHILTMKDGTIIKYRMYSSSKDGSPVVELEISGLKRVKSQKIHFVQGGSND